jgi:hypothetical protein
MRSVRALQAGLRDRLDVLGPAIETTTALLGLRVQVEAELRRDHNLVPDRLQRLAHQLFVDERPIHFRRIEQGHASLHREADESDHVLLVCSRSVVGAHAHAAEPQCGHLEPLAQFAGFHCDILMVLLAALQPLIDAFHRLAFLIGLHDKAFLQTRSRCVTCNHVAAVAQPVSTVGHERHQRFARQVVT